MSAINTPRFSPEGLRQYEETHHPTSAINVGEVERWASAVGGALLVAHGLRKGSFGGLSLAVLGGSLVYRGFTGHCQAYAALQIDTSDKHQADSTSHIHQGRLIKHSLTVNKPARELYDYWRDVENSPRFMTNIESVQKVDDTTSHWVSTGPLGKTFAWDSRVIADDPGRMFAWKSLPGGAVDNAGSGHIEPATGERGTVVTLQVNFEPPAGAIGLTVAKLIGQDPDRQALENLRRFKQLMETGEIATTEGQPSGRASRS